MIFATQTLLPSCFFGNWSNHVPVLLASRWKPRPVDLRKQRKTRRSQEALMPRTILSYPAADAFPIYAGRCRERKEQKGIVVSLPLGIRPHSVVKETNLYEDHRNFIRRRERADA